MALKGATPERNSRRKKQELYQMARKLSDEDRIPYPRAYQKILDARKAERRKRAKKICAFGEEKTCHEWVQSDVCVLRKTSTLHNRVFKLGWDPEKALTTPPNNNSRKLR